MGLKVSKELISVHHSSSLSGRICKQCIHVFSFLFFWVVFYELQVFFSNIYVWACIVNVAEIGLFSAYALNLLPNNVLK